MKTTTRLLIASCLMLALSPVSMAQTVYSSGAAAELEMPPATIYVIMREPKPSLKSKAAGAARAVKDAVKAPLCAAGRGCKKLGKAIHKGNIKLHPVRDVAETVLTALSFVFFIRNNFGY